MQGMGLAPLVVLATSGQNALMLAVAVALLLTPSRMLACLLSRLFPLREEHPANAELEKKLLPRSILYSGSAAVVYLAAYPILNRLFGVSLLVQMCIRDRCRSGRSPSDRALPAPAGWPKPGWARGSHSLPRLQP